MTILQRNDRRHAVRIIERLPVYIESIAGNSQVPVVASSKTISDYGFTVWTESTLPLKEEIRFQIILSQPFQIVKGMGQIIWNDSVRKTCGIKFTQMDENYRKIFNEYVNRPTLTREFLLDRRNESDRRAINGVEHINKRGSDRRRKHGDPLARADMLPRRKKEKDYLRATVAKRIEYLERRTGKKFEHLKNFNEDSSLLIRNVENLIGTTIVPLGMAGPIKVIGKYAHGTFYVPMATTQGTLIESYHRGALLVSEAGGAKVVIHKDEIHLDPVFTMKNMDDSVRFMAWIKENDEAIKKKAKESTRYGNLLKLTAIPLGRRVIVNFAYNTGDAMGLNMINIATDHACRWIMKEVQPENYYLRSNFSSDKKASFYNFIMSYGKEVTAEVVLPRGIIERYMRTTAEEIYDFWYSALLGCIQAGMIGMNAHFANGLSAIYVATGQDVAQVVNASTGMLFMEFTKERDLKITTKFPQLLVATVGGGTSLGSQREALEIMGCYGPGKVKKFAEIVAATLLAGEISICGALASGEFGFADIALRSRKSSQ